MQSPSLRNIVTLDTLESEGQHVAAAGCVDWRGRVVGGEVTAPQLLSDVLNTFLFATFLIFDVLYIVFEK